MQARTSDSAVDDSAVLQLNRHRLAGQFHQKPAQPHQEAGKKSKKKPHNTHIFPHRTVSRPTAVSKPPHSDRETRAENSGRSTAGRRHHLQTPGQGVKSAVSGCVWNGAAAPCCSGLRRVSAPLLHETVTQSSAQHSDGRRDAADSRRDAEMAMHHDTDSGGCGGACRAQQGTGGRGDGCTGRLRHHPTPAQGIRGPVRTARASWRRWRRLAHVRRNRALSTVGVLPPQICTFVAAVFDRRFGAFLLRFCWFQG